MAEKKPRFRRKQNREKDLRGTYRRCKVEGCVRQSKCQGMCNMHHLRWWKYGDPMVTKTAWGRIKGPWPVPGKDRKNLEIGKKLKRGKWD